MSDFVESAPENWSCPLNFSSVPKDGSPVGLECTLELEAPVRHWGLVYTFAEPLSVSVSAYYSDGRVVADISLSARGSVPCARCLEPAGLEIKSNLSYLFSLSSRADVEAEAEMSEEGKSDDGVIIVDSWEAETDLAPLVWEVLIMSLPPSPKCSESCKGLCSVCGANLNLKECGCERKQTDPRLEVLKNFKIGDEEE